jgi:hypothetical protein
MATGAPVVDDKENKTPPEGTTPAGATVDDKKAKEPVTPPPAKAKETPASGEPNERKRASLKGDDDDIPDDADLLELTPRALKSRLTRHSKKELKERFGTDDPAEITAKLKRLEVLEKEEEERKAANLTEKERLEKERDVQKARADAAELKARTVHEERVFEKQENRLTRLAEKYLDPDYVDLELPKLAKWLKANFSKEQLKTLKDKDIEPFFAERIEKKPKLSKDYAASSDKTTKDEKVKKPLNNGADPSERPDPSKSGGAGGPKNYAPGKQDSMSRAEAKAQAAKEGYNW